MGRVAGAALGTMNDIRFLAALVWELVGGAVAWVLLLFALLLWMGSS